MNESAIIIIAAEFALLLILVAFSAFFSGSETALFSLSRARLFSYKSEPCITRRRIAELMHDYHNTLITLVLGNMFVNTCISMLNEEILSNLKLNQYLQLAASIFITVIILLIFGEVTPKAIAIINPEKFADIVADKVWFIRSALKHLIKLCNRMFSFILDRLGRKKQSPLDAEEYASYIEMSHSVGAFSDKEAEMLGNIFMLRKFKVGRIMRPRTDLDCVSLSMSGAEVSELIKKSCQLFYPVVKDEIDDAESILSSREFFLLDASKRQEWQKQSCVFSSKFIPEKASLIKALSSLKKFKTPVALVTDEYGGVSGILYLKDIYEEIVGNIELEYDTPDWEAKKISENKWRVNGQMATGDLAEIIGWNAPEDSANTVNGIFLDTLERIPAPGDKVNFGDIEFSAISVQNNRIGEVEVIYPYDNQDEEL